MNSAYPDWHDLWTFTVRWTAQPVPGVQLPDFAQVSCARATLEKLMNHFPVLPARAEALAFLQEQARLDSLKATATAREEIRDPLVWREPEWLPGGPGLLVSDLDALEISAKNRAWQTLIDSVRTLISSIIRRQGVAEPDVEDTFFEVISELNFLRPAKQTRLLDEMDVFEQLPRLLSVVARNHAVGVMRKQSTRKNQPNNPKQTDSLSDPDSPGQRVADSRSTLWHDDPFSLLTFDQIYQGCRDALSEIQWRIIIGLFIDELQVIDLCHDEELGRLMNFSGRSDATRRRHIGEQLQTALDQLAACLKSRDLWPSA